MSNNYRIWENETEYNTWIVQENTAQGYPNAEIKTDTYTNFVPHPTDGRGTSIIDEKCINVPTDLNTFAEMQTFGWFPEGV